MKLAMQYMDSPVGRLRLIANEKALVAVLWENEQPKRIQLAELVVEPEHPVLLQVRQQLEEYFEGNRQRFDIPLDFAGTEFQKLVWTELLKFLMDRPVVMGRLLKRLVDLRRCAP